MYSYLTPPLFTVEKYPEPQTIEDFRGRKGSGDEALIIVCLCHYCPTKVEHRGQH